MSTVLVRDSDYEAIAIEFLKHFVDGIVRSLLNSRHYTLDLENVTDDDVNFIYELCFAALARIEDFGGFSSGGDTYVAHCLFATEPISPPQLLASWNRAFLHGGLDDEIIRSVVDSVMRRSS